jgi:thiol-disulfide isomerase/thioredoxin
MKWNKLLFILLGLLCVQEDIFSQTQLPLSNVDSVPAKTEELQSQKLIKKIFDLSAMIARSTGNLDENFIAQKPLINEYVLQASGLLRDNQNTGPLQIALSQFGPHDDSLNREMITLLKQSNDSAAIASAAYLEKVLALYKNERAQLSVGSLKKGAQIELKNYRNKKIILVEFWNVTCSGCIAAMPKYDRIYRQFKNDGFEMISVCVLGIFSKDEAALEAERKKAIALQTKMGVTYTSAEIVVAKDAKGEDDESKPFGWKKYFGNALGGTAYLIDKDGHIVTTSISGNWLEFNIRKLLKLRLDETGKN